MIFTKRPLVFVVGLLSFAFLFALLGWFHLGMVGSHFQTPQRLSEKEWDWKTSSNRHSASVGREAYIADGRLTIGSYQRLSYFKQVGLEAIEIELGSDSGIGIFHMTGQNRQSDVALSPTAYGLQPKAVVNMPAAADSVYRIDLSKDSATMSFGGQNVSLNSSIQDKAQGKGMMTFTIEAADKPVHIKRISLLGFNDTAYFQSDFQRQCQLPEWKRLGALVGALVGGIFWALVRRPKRLIKVAPAFILAVIPLFWVSTWPLSHWMSWVERMYLVNTKDWELARIGVSLSSLPLFGVLVLFSGLGLTDDGEPHHNGLKIKIGALVCPLIALYFAADSQQPSWVFLFGLCVLLAPIALSFRKEAPLKGLLIREIPVWFLAGSLGLGIGLLIGLCWRMAILAASAGTLRRRHAGATVGLLFFCFLSLPISLEVSARQTYLNEAWIPEKLSLAYSADDPQRFIEPFWSKSCGEWDPPEKQTVLFMGGSSTGNNQYKPKPPQMFTALVHQELCRRMAENEGIETFNYGRGGLDSHILSRSLDDLFQQRVPDVLVLYMGVNDLLARDSSLSKGQQEAVMDKWRQQLSGVQKITAQSRVLIGGSLLARRVQKSKNTVPNVPLVEAKSNFESIVKIAQENRVSVLLTTEYVRPDLEALKGKGDTLQAYAAMQADLAKENEGVDFIDVQSEMAPFASEALLYDTNHLTPKGYLRISQIMQPSISQILKSRRLK